MQSSGSTNIWMPGNARPRSAAGTARSWSSGTGPMMQSQGQTSTHAVSQVPTHFWVITYAMHVAESSAHAAGSYAKSRARLVGCTEISVVVHWDFGDTLAG